MQNCVVRLQEMDRAFTPDPPSNDINAIPNHNGFWKWHDNAPKVNLFNNVFRADSVSQEGPSISMSMFPFGNKQNSASGNTLCWLGDGSGPPGEAVPSGWTVLTGQPAIDFWNAAEAQWYAEHPYTTVDVWPPLCSMFQPGTKGSTTFTGTVTLISTAVDNRGGGQGVQGVQFKLNGSNIGAEVLAPTPYQITVKGHVGFDRFTKYQLAFNSTTVANGTYTLTATARDGAGNSTTSVGVTITVAN